ncbi:hypothetical protein CDV36_010485 [Fusarium kuroshium]|uniref:Uncharacterized protein n=1 Tax=Fusarium kuroshium TaxID=2010991 RepID=A0A3M2RX57_9HYPO|nr:hypothetical protein CDV36_010485 [Fusarium kuroshium]
MLNESLKQQYTMYLPGEGLFLLKDPTLNKRGDLLTTLSWVGTVGAAANGGANIAAMGNEDDILEEPDLSSVQHLPKRQPLYVLDEDVSPGVIKTADFDDEPVNLLEVDLNDMLVGIREEDRDMAMERLVAMREAIRTANQEKDQVDVMSKKDDEVLEE